MFGREPQSFENLFSNEEFAKFLNQLDWTWSKHGYGKETIFIKEIEKKSILIAYIIKQMTYFDLDEYRYIHEGKWFERTGIKVRRPPKPLKYKIIKGFN